MGFQNLLTITFPPSKGDGERISMGMITEWEGMSRVKKGKLLRGQPDQKKGRAISDSASLFEN